MLFELPFFSSPEPKAHWWAYRIVRPLSYVFHLSVCRPHSFNISSETAWPVKVQFHMEPPLNGGTKVYSNGPGHMTKMATMPIYGKNFKKIFSGTIRPMTLKLGMQHQVLKYYRVCSNNDPWLTLTYYSARSYLVSYGFFRNYCPLWFEISNRWPKWQEVSVDIKTLSHGGYMPPAPGLYTCIKSWKTL